MSVVKSDLIELIDNENFEFKVAPISFVQEGTTLELSSIELELRHRGIPYTFIDKTLYICKNRFYLECLHIASIWFNWKTLIGCALIPFIASILGIYADRQEYIYIVSTAIYFFVLLYSLFMTSLNTYKSAQRIENIRTKKEDDYETY